VRIINGERLAALVEASVARSTSSTGREVLWLLVWLLIFVTITTLMLRVVVPHHFNDRIAVMISAIVSGVVMIALRAYSARRA
jgi:undecaprenyl pyrophosphate phosphatase UppP